MLRETSNEQIWMAVSVTSCCFVSHKTHLHETSAGSIVQWIKHRTTDMEVDGSILTGVNFLFLRKNSFKFKYFQIWKFELPRFKTLKRQVFNWNFFIRVIFQQISIKSLSSDHRRFIKKNEFLDVTKSLHIKFSS